MTTEQSKMADELYNKIAPQRFAQENLVPRDLCERIVAALALPTGAMEPDDWQDDPSSDERWNAGVDFAMKRFCDALDVKPDSFSWDAATETVDGDVSAVIGNMLRAKFGEDWDPDTATQPSGALKIDDRTTHELMLDRDAPSESVLTADEFLHVKEAFTAFMPTSDLYTEISAQILKKLSATGALEPSDQRSDPSSGNAEAVRPPLERLWKAIVDNTTNESFWIAEILLNEIEKETGFTMAKDGVISHVVSSTVRVATLTYPPGAVPSTADIAQLIEREYRDGNDWNAIAEAVLREFPE
jgi:hypothetical protein